MLLRQLKERWASRKTAKNAFDPEKRAKILGLLQKYIPVLRCVQFIKLLLSNQHLNRFVCVSFLLFVVGIAWILVLPFDGYNKQTYISENALLPGQVRGLN